MTIIAIEGNPHSVESQSHRKENWMGDGYVEVPESLEEIAYACGGYCNLEIKDGKLVGITPVERPAPPPPEPGKYDVLRADVDYLAALGGVEL